MSIKKKAAALITSCMLAVSLASCADTSYICKTGDVSVNAGVYIYYVLNDISAQEYTYYYTNGAMSEDIINEAYGDGTMTVGDFAQSDAYVICQKIAAVYKKFDEMGLELTSDEKSMISDAVEESWNAEYYEAIGVAKSSIEQIQESTVMLQSLFTAYYDKGGIKEVPDSEINQHLSDNYIRFKLISVPKSKDDDGEAAKAKAEELVTLTETKTFDEVMEEYEKSEAEDSEAEKKDSDEEHDHNVMVNKNNSTYSENEVVKFIDGSMSNDEIATYEDDNYWYVIQKLDVLDYSKYVEDNRNSILTEMKGEDFEEEVVSWVDAYQIERNEDSYSRYTAKSVYGKYQKYLEENQ